MGDRISNELWAKDTDVDPKTQRQVEALLEWARVMEGRVGQLQMGILSLIGTVDGLVGLLVSNEPVTPEAVESARLAFLTKIEEMQKAEANAKPAIWTPPEGKIISRR